MLIFSISVPDLIEFSYFVDTPERRVWGERRPKDRVTLQIILVFTFKLRLVSVDDKYLHWPRVSVKKLYTLQQDKCKCKKFGWFTLTWDLQAVYTAINTYMHNTGSYIDL